MPIRVGVHTLEREVGRALRCTSFVISRGPSVAIRIGKALMPPEHLYLNAIAAIKGVSEFFKNNIKWKNVINTIHVQATNTPALPVYIHPKYAEAAQFYKTHKPTEQQETNNKNDSNNKNNNDILNKNKIKNIKFKKNKADNEKLKKNKNLHFLADKRKIKRGGQKEGKGKKMLKNK